MRRARCHFSAATLAGVVASDLAIAARVVVGLVFVVSGAAKLVNVWRSRQTYAELGVYAVIAVLTAASLPLLEIAIAALVLFVHSTWPVIVAAVAFAIFTGVLVRRLLVGDLRPCNCFGQVSARQALSNLSLARNGWFLALAILATGAARLAEPTHGISTLVFGAALGGVTGVLIART
jgi:hypothetical protein